MKVFNYLRLIVISLIISISLTCRAQQTTQAHIQTDDCTMNFTCYIENNTALACCYSISQRYSGTYVKSVDFPDYVNVSGIDYKVIEIGNQACDANKTSSLRLQKVNLPKTVESIGDYAFRKCWCNSIVFPNQLKMIGEYAFKDSRLTFVELPMNIQSVGTGAFQNCNIDTVVVNNSAKLGQDVFAGNNNLKTIIYCSANAPQNWVAVDKTYVPDLTQYSSPSSYIGIYHIHEMISWKQTTFGYTGKVHIPEYTNNVNGYTVTMDFGNLHKDVGTWCDDIIAYFADKNNGHDFTATIPFRYTILPQEIVAFVENEKKSYGDENPQFIITYSGFVNDENESVITTKPIAATTATKTSDVGEYPITISGGEAQNYIFVYEPGVLTITKAPLTAKVNDETRQYGKDNPTFAVTYTGLKNDETAPKWTEALNIETTATKQSDVGTYDIVATGVPTNYDLSKIENGTLTITQAPLTLKANDATRKYYGEEPEFTYTCSGFVNDDDTQVLTKSPTFTTDATKTSDVGKYQITPSGAEAKNYAISYEQGELTVTKRTLEATSQCTRQYGEENPVLSIEYEGFVNDEDEKVLSTKPVATTTATKTSEVGEYPITLRGGEATNYDFVYYQGVLTVTKAALSAKVSDATKVYGENNPAFTIEYYGLKNGETVPTWTMAPTFETDATKSSGVGQYTISAVNGIAVNYDMNIDDGILTVTQAPLTLIANDATRKYYEEEPEFTYTCSGFVNDDDTQVLTKTPTITTDATKSSCVGKYQITPSDAEAKNYAINYEQGELAIVKRSLTATSHCSRSYGEDNPVFPIEYDGFVNNETESVLSIKPTGTTTATKTSKVGEYPITISGGEAMNYDFVYKKGVLTVTKATLSAKVNDATKVYGENNPTFTIEYYGLKNGETVPTWKTAPTFKSDATKASDVGQYVVSAIGGVSVNYDLAIDDGTLTITPAPLTIQAKNVTRQYYSENPTFSYSFSGFVNGDDKSVLTLEPTLSSSASLTSNVGEYNIEVNGASSTNYSISYVNGTLTVTPRTLIASVGNYDRIYNEENPEFEVKYDGFVGNDDENVLISKAIASTIATKTSDVGTYPINVTDGSADNYKFSYISGTLTINKAEQTISWEQDLSNLKVGEQVELQAVASSGLPITYTMESNSYAEIYSAGNNKKYLDCKAEGQFVIRAVQEGNKNYYSSTRINITVTIGNGESAVKSVVNSLVKIQVMDYGIRVSDANSGDVIRVYSVDGTLQKSVKAEGHITDIPLSKDKVYIVKVGGKTVKLSL